MATPDTQPTEPVAFELDAELLAASKRTRKSTEQPGIYLDEVATAVANPASVYGIIITEERKESTIINQLHKSAKQSGAKLRVFSRLDAVKADGTPVPPFVGYQFKEAAPAA